MKFVLKTIKQGALCFLATPLLMSILYFFYAAGKVSGETELHPIIESLINFRYSSEGFAWSLAICAFVVIISALLIRFVGLKKHAKIKYSKAFNFSALFVSNTLMFWAGVFFAWSFASRFIPFVREIQGQEMACIMLIFIAVVLKYLIFKLKHKIVNG